MFGYLEALAALAVIGFGIWFVYWCTKSIVDEYFWWREKENGDSP